jgi:hypothetical protein
MSKAPENSFFVDEVTHFNEADYQRFKQLMAQKKYEYVSPSNKKVIINNTNITIQNSVINGNFQGNNN